MSLLADIPFEDVFLGKENRYLTGVKGEVSPFLPPLNITDELNDLWLSCETKHKETSSREFALSWSDITFRASFLEGAKEDVYILRRMMSCVPDIKSLGLHSFIVDKLLKQDITGLIVISGSFASGKTTTASALLRSRLQKHSGVAVTIEDPPEMPLEGSHGNGICYQVTVNESKGESFSFLTKMAARWSPNIIFLGEIRDGKSAIEALKASINGRLVICTLHSDNIVSGVERLVRFASEVKGSGDIHSLIAMGLYGFIHQKLEINPLTKERELSIKFLFAKDVKNDISVRSLIKTNKILQLNSEIMLQNAKLLAENKL